ncbi:1-deoxy-D-xylulose-5-phosphate reductoisomerase [Jatrophihabitans telluris]|uniref:1-deoxy-D-xylulose 5-phosphate reductoisomerase n=1 Tax=Jatrophihabitans telluris TaxID=2038343 RepID=A0ABY4R277_9ACTN|nr:1-deoxy-D-xylulose-5-phosphate reductoisomerase [Jatrophihabitans telluris]UQX90033.1 1-deoxy-D-xylulose-5-phosphate reductoisomerase [Jatrophihabitans telluris]
MNRPADQVDTDGPAAGRPRRIVLLGSTGSIGTQTVEVIAAASDRFEIVGLAAGGSNPALLIEQAVATGALLLAVSDESARTEVEARIERDWPADRPRPTVSYGPGATSDLAGAETDVVLNGVAGAQGLRATLAALAAGHTVALANKESLIAGGPLVLAAAKPGQLVPVDSEHSALAQALRSGTHEEVASLILTASGGPFRGRSRAELADVTPTQALAHPTWAMGKLITTNSATLVNKGLELIEAALLFDVDYDRIAVVVHPTSIVHSMVEFTDGSTLAQASPPDMRLPISLALDWPRRVPNAAHPVDWTQAQDWHFEPVDHVAFPAIGLARTAGRAGGCAPAVFNAANEELVAAFHAGRCGFLDIVDGAADVLQLWLDSEHAAAGNPRDVADVEEAERWARARSLRTIAS